MNNKQLVAIGIRRKGESGFTVKKGKNMLSPEEIKSKLVLKKVTQAKLAEECGISRSQLSTIINKGSLVIERLTEILGENPFLTSTEKS